MSDKLELIPVEDIKVTKGMTVDQMLKAMGLSLIHISEPTRP